MIFGIWVTNSEADVEEEMDALVSFAGRVAPEVVAASLEQPVDDGYDDGLPTILWAATRWVTSLDLPADEDQLWTGPPLLHRTRDLRLDPHLPSVDVPN